MFKIILTTVLLSSVQFTTPHQDAALTQKPLHSHSKASPAKIQVALLLDTSNSMDGLIDQTKAQLWKMVNRLADAQRQYEGAVLEIALFEYGNSGLNATNGHIRLVHPLSTDLDGLSEKLFQLKTNGGDEYCGWVIRDALKDIVWSAAPNDLKIIVIAGNEPFNQGVVDAKISCQAAAERGIIINTIHCGDYDQGVSDGWKLGADMGKGKYMVIDTEKKVVHISTPYDSMMLECNARLNRTYIGYGVEGEAKKERQIVQDQNASSYGAANMVKRAAAKSKSAYKNEDWDLVDAYEADDKFVEKMEEKSIPEPLKGKDKEEITQEVKRLQAERLAVRQELAQLEKKMAAYIVEEMKKQVGSEETLDNVLIQAVVEQAKAKGFVFE